MYAKSSVFLGPDPALINFWIHYAIYILNNSRSGITHSVECLWTQAPPMLVRVQVHGSKNGSAAMLTLNRLAGTAPEANVTRGQNWGISGSTKRINVL